MRAASQSVHGAVTGFRRFTRAAKARSFAAAASTSYAQRHMANENAQLFACRLKGKSQ
jgi:hypothetical protein